MHFHLAFYQLSKIMRRMMKQLYLNVDSKSGAWELIRDISETLQEFHVQLPRHLQFITAESSVKTTNDGILRNQAVFLNLLYNHISILCCRPLLVQPGASSTSDALTRRRWAYCREIAQYSSNRIAGNIEEAQKGGHLARMLYSVCGLWLYACEVQALRAIVSPPNSAETQEATRTMNKFLAFFTHSDRPSPHTPQMMAILKECMRIVKRISSDGASNASEDTIVVVSQPPIEEPVQSTEPVVNDQIFSFSPTALYEFLDQDCFPALAMDDIMAYNSMSTVWGGLPERADEDKYPGVFETIGEDSR